MLVTRPRLYKLSEQAHARFGLLTGSNPKNLAFGLVYMVDAQAECCADLSSRRAK